MITCLKGWFVGKKERQYEKKHQPYLIVALLALWPAGAQAAHNNCNPREEVATALEREYLEVPVHMGLANNGTIVEVFASPNGETFTIVYTRPDGRTCGMVAGKNWENLPPQAVDAPAT